jgi:hypothetical protein
MRMRLGDDSCDEREILIQRRLDNHIEEFRSHSEAEQERWDKLLSAQEKNNEAIREIAESTRDIVDAWQATSGAIKVGKSVGRFVKWVGGFAIIGVIAQWLSHLSIK